MIIKVRGKKPPQLGNLSRPARVYRVETPTPGVRDEEVIMNTATNLSAARRSRATRAARTLGALAATATAGLLVVGLAGATTHAAPSTSDRQAQGQAVPQTVAKASADAQMVMSVAAKPKPKSLLLGQSADRGSYEVWVHGVDLSRDEKGVLFGGAANVSLCVNNLPQGQRSMKVTWDDWSMATSRGAFESGMVTEWYQDEDLFPYQASLKKGECAGGLVPFLVMGKGSVKTVTFDKADASPIVWQVR